MIEEKKKTVIAVKKVKKTDTEVSGGDAAKKVSAKKDMKEMGKYFEAVGRRKTAIARVRLYVGGKENIVNGKKMEEYFPTKEMQHIVESPLVLMGLLGQMSVISLAKGGGIHAQSEAVRHGISRAFLKYNLEFRKKLKKEKFLSRDQRTKERRKFGLKKARKAEQWSKR